MVWHPRNPDLTLGIYNDFGFKMLVDCWAGDGSWAVANLKNSVPNPYVGLTMCGHHAALLSRITNTAIKRAMATDGHRFCDKESLQLTEGLFPDVVKLIEDPEPQVFPEDDEDDVSVQSDVDERTPQRERLRGHNALV